METILYPPRDTWKELSSRPAIGTETLEDTCREVFNAVKKEGDAALSRYTEMFDKVALDSFQVSEQEKEACEALVPDELKRAILQARDNIEKFHRSQIYTPAPVQTAPGVVCRQELRPIERIGLYIPGGSAPLFSTVLMLAVPAKVVDCPEVILCTPPSRDGSINPVVLWTALQCGVDKIFKVGGTQAIAAMSVGTETIPAVYKIFGPGNQYVTAAKQMAQRYGVAIDMPAGPSEVMVIADDTAYPEYIAADMLSQAEHGPDSQAILLTTCPDMPEKVSRYIDTQLDRLARRQMAEKALGHSKMIVLKDMDECMEFSNMYAPEHLILCVEDCESRAREVNNAGSVFLGNYSPESAGDYASGTNHTLPTSAYARAYSGVNIDAFTKKITFQHLTREGLSLLSSTIELMAENEGLQAHRYAVTVRLDRK